MLQSEIVAIAAHIHVLLRRKCGRVIDTEWLAANDEYATHIAQLLRQQAIDNEAPELNDWAQKLEEGTRQRLQQRKPEPLLSRMQTERANDAQDIRYVRGIR